MRQETDHPARAALILGEDDRAAIIAHLRAALPNEGVGLLAVEWVDRDGGRFAEARRFYPGTNFLASPVRYEMDRHELIAALRDIDDRGWALGAIVHSHPQGPPTPSRTDLARAFYPESLMVIVSFAEAAPEIRSWQLVPGDAGWLPREVPIVPGIAGNGVYRE